MRLPYTIACVLMAFASLCVRAQESDSLGDLARHARAQKESSSNELQASLSQCTEGAVSQAQILAWQLTGMSSVDIAKAISSRGINFDPHSAAAGRLSQNPFSPDVATAIASAQQSVTEAARFRSRCFQISRVPLNLLAGTTTAVRSLPCKI